MTVNLLNEFITPDRRGDEAFIIHQHATVGTVKSSRQIVEELS